MKIKNQRDFWSGLMFIVIGIAFAWGATSYNFGWALPHLGMVIALPLLVIGAAMASDEFHWKDAVINAVVLTIGCWVIFIWGLKLTIPLWPTLFAR